MDSHNLVCIIALTACAPAVVPATGTGEQPAAEAGVPTPGGSIMIGNIEDPDSLDPHKTIMATASGIMSWIYERLFYIGDDGLPKAGRSAKTIW